MPKKNQQNPNMESNPTVSVELSGKSLEVFQELNLKTMHIYEKYGIEDVPGKGSKMDSQKKIDFFIELLQFYDAGSHRNQGKYDQNLKYFMNRRYNNSMKHAAETFEKAELNKLYAIMAEKKIGDANRQLM